MIEYDMANEFFLEEIDSNISLFVKESSKRIDLKEYYISYEILAPKSCYTIWLMLSESIVAAKRQNSAICI